jgi:hypothetical protein
LNMIKLFPTFTKLVSKNYRWSKCVQVCISFTTLMCFKHSQQWFHTCHLMFKDGHLFLATKNTSRNYFLFKNIIEGNMW